MVPEVGSAGGLWHHVLLALPSLALPRSPQFLHWGCVPSALGSASWGFTLS